MSATIIVSSAVSGALGLAGIVFGAIATRNAQQAKNAYDRDTQKRDVYSRFLGALHATQLAGIRPRGPEAQEPIDPEHYQRIEGLMVLSAEVDLIAPRPVAQLSNFTSMTVINNRGQTSPEARQAVITAIIKLTDTMKADLEGH